MANDINVLEHEPLRNQIKFDPSNTRIHESSNYIMLNELWRESYFE